MSEPPPGRERGDGRGQPGRGDGRGQISRADILHAAIALIDTGGLAQLTMRRLGSALGVESMSLYHYFSSRRVLLDALVDSVVSEVATDPASQMVADDDWTDYLHRLAHGVRRMALTHPRVFPLIASHPTEAPWIRPPIRSLRWVDAFLEGLQDHDFPPPAAVTAYKKFSTFLLGHLLLEVGALGLDHPDETAAPPPPPDQDRADAEQLRADRAENAAAVLTGPDTPDAADIVAATASRPPTVADEPALRSAALQQPEGSPGDPRPAGQAAAAADVDLPVTAAIVSVASLDLGRYRHVAALAGLLSQDTAAADFDADLDQLLIQLERLRRP